eukprot:scaffold69474_cov75-Phaeocystis_antarctica.AAC.2
MVGIWSRPGRRPRIRESAREEPAVGDVLQRLWLLAGHRGSLHQVCRVYRDNGYGDFQLVARCLAA